MKTVLVFGVFDHLHPGHVAFLEEAKQLGDRLVVSLAQDSVVAELKGSVPSLEMKDRKKALEDLGVVDEVFAGDLTLGTYKAVAAAKADIVAFGYDQEALRDDFERFSDERGLSIKTRTLSPHKPEEYKSSILKANP